MSRFSLSALVLLLGLAFAPAWNAAPAAAQEVSGKFTGGSVQVGNDTGTCDSNRYGSIRFNANKFQGCSTGGWVDIGTFGTTAGITALTGDVTASGTGSVATTIANNAVTSIKIADGTVALADLAANSVDSSKIVDGSVSNADLAGSIALSKLSITGTGSTSNFLRGDGSWQAVPSGADNLGNHTATQALNMGSFNITNAGTITGTTITGTTFSGSGASLTALNAANLASGTVPAARLPAYTGDVTKAAGGTALTIAAGAVDLAHMSATGTKNNTTFLRGDNTWAVPPAGGGGVSGRTSVTCTHTGGGIGVKSTCIATCTSGYYVSGCSAWVGTNWTMQDPQATGIRPSGNGCECIGSTNIRINCTAFCVQ